MQTNDCISTCENERRIYDSQPAGQWRVVSWSSGGWIYITTLSILPELNLTKTKDMYIDFRRNAPGSVSTEINDPAVENSQDL